MKLRKPQDRSASSMIVEPPYNLNAPADDSDSHAPFRWRHMMYEVELSSDCCIILTIHWMADKHVVKTCGNTELEWIRYGRFVLPIMKQ